MKTTIETLEFPYVFKKKLKMKASLGNLSINFTPGHFIKFNNTNLIITKPYKIIAKNNFNDMLHFSLIIDNSFKPLMCRDIEEEISKYEKMN